MWSDLLDTSAFHSREDRIGARIDLALTAPVDMGAGVLLSLPDANSPGSEPDGAKTKGASTCSET
jgi:hypothetical protein